MLLARFILTIVAFAGLASALFAGTFTFTTLSDPSATGGTSASGINDEGQIVGTFIGPNVCAPYGLVCTNNGFLYDGGTFTNRALGSDFTGINNLGQIVGYSLYLGSSFNYVPSAFLYSGGVSTAIPTPCSYFDGTLEHGFLYGNGIFTTIDDPLASAGSYPSQSDGTMVNGINSEGQIVGSYTVATGQEYGFVATPGALPEPSTLSLAFAASLFLLGCGARKLLRD